VQKNNWITDRRSNKEVEKII